MKVTLVLSGLSSACAQSLTALPSSRPSTNSLSSSSASNSTSSASIVLSSSSSSYSSSASARSSSQNTESVLPSPVNATSSASSSPRPTAYVNPWAGNFSSPVPQHGTGSAFALQCQNAWYSFTSINTDDLKVSASRGYVTETIRSTTVYEVHTYYETQYFTLCDGHPRVITSTPTATITTTLAPSTTTYLNERIGWSKFPNPNCTVNWDDCDGLWSRYSTAKSVYDAISFEKANTVVSLGPGASYWVVNGVTTTFPTPSPAEISLGTESIEKYYIKNQYLIITRPPPGGLVCACGKTMTAGGPPVTIQNTISFTNTPYTPSCRTAKPTCTPGAQCKISGDEVEIFWFPPQYNATRDLCATAPPTFITSQPPTNFTWSPITTGPYAVLPGNTTWYSGNVYVSLKGINAQCNWSGTSVEVGSTQHGNVLTMAPSELLSLRATWGPWTERGSLASSIGYGNNLYSFNFADLVSPYPWSAWAGLDYCVVNKCSTMSGPYNPRIAVPEAIRRLDPRWSTCDLDLGGLYDPPIALSSVGNMFASTTVPPQGGPGPTPGQSPPQQNEPTHTPIVPGLPLPWQSDPPKNPGNSGPPPSEDGPLNPQDPPRPSVPSDPSKPGDSDTNPQPNPAPNPAPNPVPVPNPTPQVTPAPIVLPPTPTTVGSIGTVPIIINPSNPSQINIGTTILTPGSPALTLGPNRDTTVSLQDPTHLVINTPGAAAPSTINLPQPGAPTPSSGAIITLPNGERVTATAILGDGANGGKATSVLVSGTLFSVGSTPLTLSNGLVLSQAPSGSGVVVINTSSGVTSTLAFSSIPDINTPAPNISPAPTALVTIGGRVYTATSRDGSVVIPDLGVTLSEGGDGVTVNGTVVVGARTGVAVGSTTVGFETPTPGAGVSGSARGSGRGNGNVAVATGGAGKMTPGVWWVGMAVGVLGAMVSM
ncbi:hypothetical protein BKA63DRAFT_485390 [Paraphoma chrysanthemicola]|nr:hypothetical protein BKA63DRAFT_485390 [Paraphoma chrysanthemicola]